MRQLSAPVATLPGPSRGRLPRTQSQSQSQTARPPAASPPSSNSAELNLGELFLHTRDAVIVGDTQANRIVQWNPAAERLFGYTAAEAIGRPIEILIPPAIARLHRAGLDRVRRTGHGSVLNTASPMEVPALTKAGEEIRVELSLVQLEGTGDGRYVMAMFRDVSDRRRADIQSLEVARAQAGRAQAEAALAQASATMRSGVATIDRPLRRLERSAAHLARCLASGASVNHARAARRARVLEHRAERTRRAVDQLADRAAIQSGSLDLALERVNLVPLLNRVVAAARESAPAHKLTLTMPQGLTVTVDPRRFGHVVTTLIEQAVRRNPRGCWIDVDLRRPLAAQARLEVRDYGRQPAEEECQRLLESDGPEPALHVARSIVEGHGGSLTAEFPTDSGVRLIVTVPAQRIAPAAGTR